jgi:hypothetical protein
MDLLCLSIQTYKGCRMANRSKLIRSLPFIFILKTMLIVPRAGETTEPIVIGFFRSKAYL